MCGRFTLRTPLTVLAEQFQFDLESATQLTPRCNIAPTQDVAAVRLAGGKRQLAMLRWGLIPSWAKDTKTASSTINARADTVTTKPFAPRTSGVAVWCWRMTTKPVSTYVNNARNQGLECVEPSDQPE